jgi:hypothetical protein
MNGPAKLLGLLAIGWALLAIALSQSLPPAEFGLALGTVVFAECLSSVISTRRPSNAGGTIEENQDVLAKSLLAWTLLCVLLIPLFQLDYLAFFQGQPSAMLSLLALTLVMMLLKHFSAANFPARLVRSMRLVVPAAIVLALNWVGAKGAGLFLSSLVLSHLVLLLAVVLLAHKTDKKAGQHNCTLPLHAVAHYADLLICPLILSGTNALLYVTARGLGLAVTAVLVQLGDRANPALLAARQQRNRLQFITMAARLNLGFLLVGGSAGLAALTIGPYLASAFQLDGASFQTVLFWVVLGACAPVFFGATETLLLATKRQNITMMSNLVGVGIIASATLFAKQPDAFLLAKWFAAVLLAKTGACALFLIRNAGVWPGLTALLLRQIRLF